MKELYRPTDVPKTIKNIRFSLSTEADIQQLANVQILKCLLYKEDQGGRKALEYGLLDPRLGASKRNELCETCGLDYQACIGHWGNVKKGTGLSYIIHDVSKLVGKNVDEYVDKLSTASDTNPELPALARKCVETIRPARALQLFSKIPTEDLPLLLMPFGCEWATHPRNLILQRIPVPPNAIRPSVVSEVKSGTNEDDLTQMYQWILAQAATLEEDIPEADQIACLDNLHAEVARIINSQHSGLPPVQDHKFMRGLLQRLSGKHGRFRGNLLGKRTNFTARTVISPDPNLRIDQVCVPVHCAKLLTYPERVTQFNIEFLRKLILNGPKTHPGALFVSYRATARDVQNAEPGKGLQAGGIVKKYLANKRIQENVAKTLRIGDLVERHLVDDDIVLFNRQPSLHRVSIQAMKATVKQNRTFRFNPCCCTPFNADFDGDEMNIHLPQTEEARAEAKHLMLTLKNISSPKNGEPLISPIQDLITATHLLTLKDVFFTWDQACQLACQIVSGIHVGRPLQLPPPAIMWPTRLWTGKQIFNLILSPHPSCEVKISLRVPTKSIYSGLGEELCPNDGFVVIFNSELMAGCMDKKLLGGGSKASIFYSILRDYGGDACADAMWRLGRISLFYLAHRGFSIGIGEVTPCPRLRAAKEQLIHQGFAKCEDFIKQYENNTLKCNPGCSMEETLESSLSQELSKIRDEAGSACKRTLYPSNSPLVMAQSGSKGSFLNISQMIACVGQQIIGGKRVPDSLNGRSLIHFPPGSRTPAAKGFVGNSFYSGLTPSEFFFHAMSGREGLTDTAVKTADTGYMQRRIVKFLEDLTVTYDGTVRDSRGDIVQFRYGSDGLDPCEMELEAFPADLKRELANIRGITPCYSEPSMTAEEVEIAIEAALRLPAFRDLDGLLSSHIKSFFDTHVLPRMRAVPWRSESAAAQDATDQVERLTRTQLRLFLMRVKKKYERALMEPGTAVGALCGQSIGEPATQMTLKTFHFAGVASMNITQGVPRMREIVNAVANIKTPLITVTLSDPFSGWLARRVKLSIELTRLADIALRLRQCLTPDDVYVAVELDLKRMKRREITPAQTAAAIRAAKLKNLKLSRVTYSENYVNVYPVDLNKLETLTTLLETVVVKGIPDVARVVVQEAQDGQHRVFVEGAKLQEVMCIPGVVPEKTKSNNILEVERVLGVEAARRVVMDELLAVMEGHGVEVNIRHVMLLADLMTNRGEVYGYQRSGMAKGKNSVLCLASFERTGDHLFEAAYHAQDDNLTGVTESIIVGNPTRIGTGTFDLLGRWWQPDVDLQLKSTLMESL
ncbi:DNA-directed RNA polymerase III subunit RPC1 [Sparganum proliferum]